MEKRNLIIKKQNTEEVQIGYNFSFQKTKLREKLATFKALTKNSRELKKFQDTTSLTTQEETLANEAINNCLGKKTTRATKLVNAQSLKNLTNYSHFRVF